MIPDFDTLSVVPVEKAVAKDICVRNHYSKKWNSPFGSRCYGLVFQNEIVGVAVYGYPMNPKSWATITKSNPDKCIELNRLWIDDCLGKNTESWFLSATFKELRKEGFQLVQSFADGRLGVGTIYQATNFGFYGSHTTIFQEAKTGEVFHNGKFADTASAATMVRRNVMHAEGMLTTFEVHTYRYLYALTHRAKKDILLSPQPYPKERFGKKVLTDYKPPASQIARATALAQTLGMVEEQRKLEAYLHTLCDNGQQLIQECFDNKWIAALQQEEQEEMETLF